MRQMASVETLKVVVVGPSDVRAEVEQVRAVLDNLNQEIAEDRQIRLEYVNWRTHAYPGAHSLGPQGLIDEVLRIPDARLVIAIFWKRFGTPTASGETGTEHEVQRAYESWARARRPEVMVYFNRDKVDLATGEDRRQYNAVCEFREDLPAKYPQILHGEYPNTDAFVSKIRSALVNWLKQNYPILQGQKQEFPSQSVYVASVAADLTQERQSLVRELGARGWWVLPPEGALPASTAEQNAETRRYLRRSAMSVHLAGRQYCELAEREATAAAAVGKRRILWVQPGASEDLSTGKKQREFLASFERDPDLRGFERWGERSETLHEDLRAALLKLKTRSPGGANVYLVYGPEDGESAGGVLRDLFELRLEVSAC